MTFGDLLAIARLLLEWVGLFTILGVIVFCLAASQSVRRGQKS